MSQEHYKPGDLNEPFYFERPTESSDGQGGTNTTLVRNPASGFHFAKVRPLRGSERVVADHLAATGEVMFVVYAGIGLTETDRLVYGGRTYNVTRVSPATSQSVFQEIEATSGVTQ